MSNMQRFIRRKRRKNFFLFNSRSYQSRINRQHSQWRILFAPIVSVFMGSLITTMPFFSDLPILPPYGFMIFIAWRLLRPGMWPMWVGMPFGLFDDIFSGALFGSAALTWSIAMLVIEFIDSRIIWRDHMLDWLIASILIVIYLFGSLLIISTIQTLPSLWIIIPQIIFSIALYPLVVRFCAKVDNWRLSQ